MAKTYLNYWEMYKSQPLKIGENVKVFVGNYKTKPSIFLNN